MVNFHFKTYEGHGGKVAVLRGSKERRKPTVKGGACNEVF